MFAKVGCTGMPLTVRLGTQYPEWSCWLRHVVPPAVNDVNVEAAFVVTLLKKSCEWLAPGCIGVNDRIIGQGVRELALRDEARRSASGPLGRRDSLLGWLAAPDETALRPRATSMTLEMTAVKTAIRPTRISILRLSTPVGRHPSEIRRDLYRATSRRPRSDARREPEPRSGPGATLRTCKPRS